MSIINRKKIPKTDTNDTNDTTYFTDICLMFVWFGEKIIFVANDGAPGTEIRFHWAGAVLLAVQLDDACIFGPCTNATWEGSTMDGTEDPLELMVLWPELE